MQRSTDVTNVSYDIVYAMLRGGETFHGQVKIKFTIREGADLSKIFVDYRGQKVLNIEVNG